MTKASCILTVAVLVVLVGCSPEQSQRNYHASIQKRCSEQGFVADTPEFKECFAKVLQRDGAREPGAKPYRRAKSLEHYMD